jgi:hypothetical protein
VSFKATVGVRSEYFGGEYGEYEVRLETVGYRLLNRTRVTLSAEQPNVDLILPVPPGSLGCDDGSWLAC